MITENITRNIAEAQVSDDCMVELDVRRKHVILTAQQARDLASELERAAFEAEKAKRELLRTERSHAFDLIESLSPDCAAGKHPAGWQDMAWSDQSDAEVPCQCGCHAAEVVS